MRLLEKFDQLTSSESDLPTEKVLSHKIGPELSRLAEFRSTRELEKSSLYQALQNEIMSLTFGFEFGCYVDRTRSKNKPFYRAICWHLEGGKNFAGILETLRNRALVSQADIYFFPAADIGMTRSGNRNVIRDLAIELGYNYFFVTSFLHLTEADGERDDTSSNRLGLEGNAIMTRLPMSNLRIIPLENFDDPMKEYDKRVGCQKALLADLTLKDDKKMTVICINLPLHSSQGQRHKYVKYILSRLKKEEIDYPILLGGDLKTSTYNCRSAKHFLLSVINKMYRGFDYVVQDHHTYPEKHFERGLFDLLSYYGFDIKKLNELGKGCYHSSPLDIAQLSPSNQNSLSLLKKLLRSYQEKMPFKYDWFAANCGLKVSQSYQAERAKVISHLFFDGRPVSSHDPILLDFELVDKGVE